MATGSLLKKKPAKRLNKKQCDSMNSRVPFNYFLGFRKTTLIVSISAILFIFILIGMSISSHTRRSSSIVLPKVYSIEVVKEFPNDPTAFTQGLLYAGNDTLFESTGLQGKSSVRKVALQTGKIEALQKMDHSYFGEGLTLLGERLFQVTWMQKIGFIYNINDLSKMKKFTHQMNDGWGLATDGKILYGSDGSSTLYRINPNTFKVITKQVVKYKGFEVNNLNELEFVNGEVWANIWMTDCIARILPEDGSVDGWILLPTLREGLVLSGIKGIDVLNGIAWDSEKNRIFVTGKLWPKLFEIKVVEANKRYNDEAIGQLCLRNAFRFT